MTGLEIAVPGLVLGGVSAATGLYQAYKGRKYRKQSRDSPDFRDEYNAQSMRDLSNFPGLGSNAMIRQPSFNVPANQSGWIPPAPQYVCIGPSYNIMPPPPLPPPCICCEGGGFFMAGGGGGFYPGPPIIPPPPPHMMFPPYW